MNGVIMKSLFQIKFCISLATLAFILTPAFAAKAQDARIQLGTLDHLAGKASQTVDVNIDGRLMQLTAKLFNSQDEDEVKIKKLINGLKGIYVKSFEFEKD